MKTFPVGRNVLPARLIPNLHPFHQVVILRIVDTHGRTNLQSALRLDKLGIQIRLMRVERSHSIRGIQVITGSLIRDDVDGTSQGIRTQTGRNHPFVDLNPFDQIDRQIGQRNTTAFRIQGNTIQKIADRIARHTIDGEVKIGTDTSLFPYTDAGRSVHHLIQVVYRIGQRFDIQRIGGKHSLSDLLRLRLAIHLHSMERDGIFAQDHILLRCPTDGTFQPKGLIAHR